MKQILGIGLLGAGAMGKAHSVAFRTVSSVFRLHMQPRLVTLVDVDLELAKIASSDWGYERYENDWKAAVNDSGIDVIDIALPNALHREVGLAAIMAGKHVYCEKPLAPSAPEAEEMMRAAEAAGVITQVGFNFLKNPIIDLARQIIESGEIGEIRSFTGIHAEDYMADASKAWTWRLDPRNGGGAVADLGSHIVAMARYLVGPITEVCASLDTVVPFRPAVSGAFAERRVDVDDQARALVKFSAGFGGTIEASWVASGRKMQLQFEIVGSKGAIAFSQERFSELQLFQYTDDESRNGFRTIMAGPLHPPYGEFCIAQGHQLGYNDLKTIEIRDMLWAIGGGQARGPDFREGWEVQKVIDAMILSASEHRWCTVS